MSITSILKIHEKRVDKDDDNENPVVKGKSRIKLSNFNLTQELYRYQDTSGSYYNKHIIKTDCLFLGKKECSKTILYLNTQSNSRAHIDHRYQAKLNS